MNRAGLLAAAGGAVAIGLAPVVPLLLAHNRDAFAVPDVHFYAVSATALLCAALARDARGAGRAPARPAHRRHRRGLHGHGLPARGARPDDARLPDRGGVHGRGRRLRRARGAARRRGAAGGTALATARARVRARPRGAADRRRGGRARVRSARAARPRCDPEHSCRPAPARLVDRRRERADLRRARAARTADVPAHAPPRRPGRDGRARVARHRSRHVPAQPGLVGRLLEPGTCSSWAPSWSSRPRS